MNRRGFIFGTAAAVVLGTSASAEAQFLNGELNRSAGTFDWTGGGNDRLRSSWTADGFRRSLAIGRLNLDAETQRGLQQVLRMAPAARVDLASFEGRVIGDVMISGEGWIATRPRVLTRRWRRGRSTMASWYVWTNRRTGERWELYVPDVCNNLVLTRLGQAVPCVCGPRDACA